MKTPRWLWVVLLALVGGRAMAATPRPNILFIYADDQPYKTLSCYPEAPDWVRTPHIDKLATRGVKAHISGDAKPFRVRLDHYNTRYEAVTRVAELKQRGIIGFVTEEPRSAGASRP